MRSDDGPEDVTVRPLDVQVVVKDERAIVSVGGEVDMATTPRLRQALDEVQTRSERSAASLTVVVDLSDVTFMDANGLGLLVAAARRARHDGGELVLRDPTRRTLRLLELTSLLDVFRVERLHAVPEPDEPRPLSRIGPSDAVVADRELDGRLLYLDVNARHRRLRVLRSVGERLRHDAVRGNVDPLWQPPVGA
jgi:anti-sigma B factor antagonist